MKRNAPSWTRTKNLLIKSQYATQEKPEENADSGEGAAPGAAVGAENESIVPELAAVIEAWSDLPEAVKVGIMAMVKAAGADS